MATFQVVLTQSLASRAVQMSFHYNNLTLGAGNPTAPQAIATEFVGEVLPLINALQSDECLNTSIYCRDLGNPATAYTASLSGAGDVISDAAGTLPPDLALQLRFTASEWINLDTNGLYVGTRPGGVGKKYLPGLAENWSSVNGAVVPIDLETAYDDFVAEMTGALSVPSLALDFNHVVFSAAKVALDDLPARAPLIADISGVTIRRVTRILSRRP